MQAAALDVLEAADFPPAQARAIVTAIDHEVSAKIETLATKQQIADLAADTKQQFAQLAASMKQQFSDLAVSVDRRFDAVTAEFAKVRAESDTEFVKVRAEIAAASASVRLEIANLRADLVRWMFVTALTQVGALLGGAWLIVRVISG